HPHQPGRLRLGHGHPLGAAGGALPRGAARGLLRRQLEPGRRLQGHLGAQVISRVADHCFWFGRYLERAESAARLLHVTGNLSLDAELTAEQCWLPVIIVSGEREHFFEKHGPDAAHDGEIVQQYMIWDDDNLTSIRSSITSARENARSIRDVVSLEAWETINELY